jgi:hypothetical protein
MIRASRLYGNTGKCDMRAREPLSGQRAETLAKYMIKGEKKNKEKEPICRMKAACFESWVSFDVRAGSAKAAE